MCWSHDLNQLHRTCAPLPLTRAVIGLSGGIDSALSCALAAEALGPQNVLAVRMPYQSSSPDSLEHAQMVIQQFGVQGETVEITDMVEPLIRRDPGMSNTRKGNLMARARMIVLYDQSEAFRGLVVGTRLLYLMVDQRYSPEECAAAGFDESLVRAVVGRICRSQFKRMNPPIAKLSNRTVGYDFLYLRDWGT